MVKDLNTGLPRANPASGQGGACTWGHSAVTAWPCWLLLIMDNIKFFLKDLPQWIVSSEMSIRRIYLGVGTWELFLCFVPFVFLGFLLCWRWVEQVLTLRMSLLGGIRLYKIITNSKLLYILLLGFCQEVVIVQEAMIYGKAPLLMALKDGVKGRGQMPVKSSMVPWFCLLQLPIDGFKLWIINSLMQSCGVCLTCPDCNSKKYMSQGLLLLHLNATPRKMTPVPIYTLYNRTPDPSCLECQILLFTW